MNGNVVNLMHSIEKRMRGVCKALKLSITYKNDIRIIFTNVGVKKGLKVMNCFLK